jgi:hypothetical protein
MVPIIVVNRSSRSAAGSTDSTSHELVVRPALFPVVPVFTDEASIRSCIEEEVAVTKAAMPHHGASGATSPSALPAGRGPAVQ